MSTSYVPQGTSKRFRIPRTLAADFDAFLDMDVPNSVMDFELLHNWYDREEDDYEPYYVRAEIYPDSTKSRYENTDNNMNIRFSLKEDIHKGDMVIEPDNSIYLLDWAIHKESNNAPSRALRCNMYLEVYTYQEDKTDEEGYLVDNDGTLIDDEGYVVDNNKEEPQSETEQNNKKIIVQKIPANGYRYDGRPEYVAVSGTPGTIAGVLTFITVQYNEQTKRIKIGQYLDWDEESYEIVDVNKSGINLAATYGTLSIRVKRAAGGLHGYE